MTHEEALAELKSLESDGGREAAHIRADEVLCAFLKSPGYADVVDAFHKIGKWYA